MAQTIKTAYYRANKGATWAAITEPGQSITNLTRINNSEFTAYGYLFSFEISDGGWYPPNMMWDDSTQRYDANQFASPEDIANGGDLKWRGNYIHPAASVITINGNSIGTNVLYYAGWNSTDGSTSIPTASRDWIEILTFTDLVTTLGISDGELCTLTIDDGDVLEPPPF